MSGSASDFQADKATGDYVVCHGVRINLNEIFNEDMLTAVLGVLEPAAWKLLVEAHALALEELIEFALPDPDEVTGLGRAVPEYDWIVTPDYAGPDRRDT